MTKALTLLRNVLVTLAVLTIAYVAATSLGVNFPSFSIHEKTVDRSQDSIALQLQGIQEFHASRGTFSVIVDLEKDTEYVPSFLLGTRATMAATGTIDTSVDFSQAIVSADETQVTVRLPLPTLSPVTLDNTKTSVIARQRGLLDRLVGVFVSSPTNDQGLYIAAANKISAAASETDLIGMAKETTTLMVNALVAPRTANIQWDNEQIVLGPPTTTQRKDQ